MEKLNDSGKIILVGKDVKTIEYGGKKDLLRLMAKAGLLLPITPILGIGGLFGARQAVRQNPMQGGYESQVRVQNGDAAFATSALLDDIADIAAGVTVRYWEMSIPPRYMYVWGSGVFGNINNQGYGYFWILDTGTDIQLDRVSLGVESYDRHNRIVVKEFQDDQTNLGVNTSAATMTPTNNQTKMLAIPQTTVIAMPYSRLVIDITCIVAATDPDLVDFSFPVTVKSS